MRCPVRCRSGRSSPSSLPRRRAAASACDSASCAIVTRGQARHAHEGGLRGRLLVPLRGRGQAASPGLVLRPGRGAAAHRLRRAAPPAGLPPRARRHRRTRCRRTSATASRRGSARARRCRSSPGKAYAAHAPRRSRTTPTDPTSPEPQPDEDPHGHGGPAAAVPVAAPYARTASATRRSALRYGVWGAGPQRLYRRRRAEAADGGVAPAQPLRRRAARPDAAAGHRIAGLPGVGARTCAAAAPSRGRRRPRISSRPRTTSTTPSATRRSSPSGLTRTLRAVYSRTIGLRVRAGEDPPARPQRVPGRAGAEHRRPHGDPLAGAARHHAGRHRASTRTCSCRCTAT